MMTDERPAHLPLLECWVCPGTLDDGRPCKRVLMELSVTSPSVIRKRCEKCGAWNIYRC